MHGATTALLSRWPDFRNIFFIVLFFFRSVARLFVSRDTLWRMERGDPTVALGTLVTALFVLGLHDRLTNLAAPASDELALSLDERRLPQRIRRPRS